MKLKLNASKTHKINVDAVLCDLSVEQLRKLAAAVDVLRDLTGSHRFTMMMLMLDNATETHTEELSFATGVLVNKIVGHYDGDRGILKGVIEGLMEGIIQSESNNGRDNGVKI